MDFLTITVKTLSPVVLTAMNNAAVMTESRDFISGTVLRGVLASRYIEAKNLGKKAQEDKTFRELFFGEICFVDAFPVYGDKRSIPLPFSLQKAKNAAADKDGRVQLLDLIRQKPEAGFKPVNGFGILEDNVVTTVSVNKRVKLHMSRSGEKERLGGRSLDGGIYNYEAVEAGQVFQGIVVGEKSKLELLKESLQLNDNKLDCYIGRSKFTEYGHCQIQFGEIKSVPEEKTKGTHICIRLETAWLPLLQTAFSAEDIIREFVETICDRTGAKDITVEKIIAKTETVANFVGVWGLKRAEQQALSAGTVFALQKESGWSENDLAVLQEALFSGQGCRTEEGFGQLRLWPETAAYLFAGKKAEGERHAIRSNAAKKIAENILMQRIKTRIRLQAEKDVHELRGKVEDATHSFARLESLLGERKDLGKAKGRFQEKLQNELRAQSVLDKRLQNLTLQGKELKEILLAKDAMPYDTLRFEEEVPKELAEDAGFVIPDKSNGILFYEYWLWFFRHGRKLAVARKGDK